MPCTSGKSPDDCHEEELGRACTSGKSPDDCHEEELGRAMHKWEES